MASLWDKVRPLLLELGETVCLKHYAALSGVDRAPGHAVTGEFDVQLRGGGVVAEVELRAKKLVENGAITRGNRVVLVSENCVEWPLCYFAILSLGCTVAQLDPALSVSELRTLIGRCDAAAVIASPAVASKLGSDFGVPSNVPVFNVRSMSLEPLKVQAGAPTARNCADEDPSVASIIFTSGTTGQPKGVMLTHDNMFWMYERVKSSIGLSKDDATVLVLPLHHVLPLMAMVAFMLAGAPVTIIDTMDESLAPHPNVAEYMMTAMGAAKPTVMALVPVVFERMAARLKTKIAEIKGPKKAVLGCLKACCPAKVAWKKIHQAFGGRVRILLSGGAAISPSIVQFYQSLGFDFIQGYGMSECTAGMTLVPPGAHVAGPVGLPFDGVEVKTTPEGEVVCRGPNVMLGYFRDSEETAKTVIDGWLHTGDEGRIDERGYLWITGRLKELIVTDGGKKIAPVAIEEKLGAIEGVAEYAVYGRKTERNTDVVAVAVVVDPSAFPSSTSPAEREATVKAYVARASAALDPAYRITHVSVVSSLPKTAKMSIKRRQLDGIVKAAEAAAAGSAASAAPAVAGEAKTGADVPTAGNGAAPTVVERFLMDAAWRLKGTEGKNLFVPTSHLQFDLGLDSMAFAQLIAMLEEEVKAPVAPAFRRAFFAGSCNTISDLAKLAVECASGDTQREAMSSAIMSRERMEAVASARADPSLYPLTGWQEMCRAVDNGAASQTYILSSATRVDGLVLKEEHLRAAVGAVVERHVLLRSKIVLNASGVPAWRASEPSDASIPITFQEVDIDVAEDLATAEQSLTQSGTRAFDFANEYPLRVGALSKPSAAASIVYLFVHHIATDALSSFYVATDLTTALRRAAGAVEGPPLPSLTAPTLPFDRYALWEKEYLASAEGCAASDRWVQLLEPASLSAPGVSGKGNNETAAEQTVVPAATITKLRSLFEKDGATTFGLLSTAIAVALEVTDYNTLTGAPGGTHLLHSAVSVRKAPFLQTVGPFINELGFPVTLENSSSVRGVLRGVSTTLTKVAQCSDYPYATVTKDKFKLVWEGPPEGGDGIFRPRTYITMYNYGNSSLPDYETRHLIAAMGGQSVTLGPVTVTPWKLSGVPKPSGGTALYFFLADLPDGGVSVSMRYDTAVVGAQKAGVIISAVSESLAAIVEGGGDVTLAKLQAALRSKCGTVGGEDSL